VGKTSGRRDEGRAKKIYAYALKRDWKGRLGREPGRQLRARSGGYKAERWTEEEFGSIELYDNRLRDRLFEVAEDLFERPGTLIAEACEGSYAKTRAAYRFFGNKKVDMETLLKPHVEATAHRVQEHPVVLAVQDTTTLDYTGHPETKGLGPVNTQGDQAIGLLLHDTLGFTPEGVPLGVLDAQCWARDSAQAGKAKKRKKLPIEEKESMKWLNSYRAVAEVQKLCPDTMLVSVGDRESDIYELFHEATQDQEGPELLVRADRGRNRQVEGKSLWEKMADEPIAGYQEVEVPARGSRRRRTAKLAVHYGKVTLNCPAGKKLPSVDVWAVYVHEVEHSRRVREPLDWLLLTTVETTDFKQACERIQWYARRWNIEVFHRTLKSACRIEDRRLHHADSLKACLLIDMVISWRIYWLTIHGRQTPDIPCDAFLAEHEWQALCAYIHKEVPPVAPPLGKAILMIGSLGGHLGRKSDPPPGTVCMRKGLDYLHALASMFQICQTHEFPRPP
jgi:hypothetical protein